MTPAFIHEYPLAPSLTDYVSLNTLNRATPDLCVLRSKPKGIEHLTYKMMTGEAIGNDYPKDRM
jgi:hypothetical protein